MNGAAFPAGRPAYLIFLPSFLFRTDERWPRYLVKAWLLALLPSLGLAALMSLAADDAAAPAVPMAAPLFLVLVIIVAPSMETLLMVPMLWVLRRFLEPGAAALASAAIWAVFHSLTVLLWGLVVWWPFLILSIAFLAWRERGLAAAILMVASIHAMQNAAVAALALGLMPGV